MRIVCGNFSRRFDRSKIKQVKESASLTSLDSVHSGWQCPPHKEFWHFHFSIHRGCKIGLLPVFGVVTAKTAIVSRGLCGVGVGVVGKMPYGTTRKARDFFWFIALKKSVP